MATRDAAARALAPELQTSDPVLRAILSAPIEDMPQTDQELRDVAEAQALGRFIPSAQVSQALAAARPR